MQVISLSFQSMVEGSPEPFFEGEVQALDYLGLWWPATITKREGTVYKVAWLDFAPSQHPPVCVDSGELLLSLTFSWKITYRICHNGRHFYFA